MLMLLFFLETTFYASHRLLHHPALYKHFHKQVGPTCPPPPPMFLRRGEFLHWRYVHLLYL